LEFFELKEEENMARGDISPDGPVCPGTNRKVSIVDIYGALYDIDRRIHVVRTLIGKLSPDIALVYGAKEVSAEWTKPTGPGQFPRVVCNQCEPADIDWPK
jgi:hypothetical protein